MTHICIAEVMSVLSLVGLCGYMVHDYYQERQGIKVRELTQKAGE